MSHLAHVLDKQHTDPPPSAVLRCPTACAQNASALYFHSLLPLHPPIQAHSTSHIPEHPMYCRPEHKQCKPGYSEYVAAAAVLGRNKVAMLPQGSHIHEWQHLVHAMYTETGQTINPTQSHTVKHRHRNGPRACITSYL